MKIDIIQARSQHRKVLNNLARYYIYDFSPYMHAQSPWYRCQASGNFNSGMGHYFKSTRNKIFMIKAAREWAGFVIVKKYKDDHDRDFNLAEFFVTRPLRGKGIGRYAAHHVFDRFRGRWDIHVLPRNEPAILFWEKVVSDYTQGEAETVFTSDHGHGRPQRLCVHRFDNRDVS